MSESMYPPGKLRAQLEELYDGHGSDLPPLAWASEVDRWTELVFCLLNQLSEMEPEVIRTAVERLAEMGLLQMDCLATLDQELNEVAVVTAYELKHYGFRPEEALWRKDTTLAAPARSGDAR